MEVLKGTRPRTSILRGRPEFCCWGLSRQPLPTLSGDFDFEPAALGCPIGNTGRRMPSPIAEFPKSKPAAFASAPSVSSARLMLSSDRRRDRLVARSPIAAYDTDDADGTDGSLRICAHSDYSVPCPAFTGERDLDAQRSQERLRPSQSACERARVFCPWRPTREVVSGSLRTQTQ
jgi:hypothetical protein